MTTRILANFLQHTNNKPILRTGLIFLLIYLYCSIFNPYFFNAKGEALICMQTYNLILNAAFLLIITQIRYVGVFIFFLLTLLFGIISYMRYEFGYELSNELIFATFETTTEESSAFITFESVSFILICSLIAFFIWKGLRYLLPNIHHKPLRKQCVWFSGLSILLIFTYFLPSVFFHKIPWSDKSIPDYVVRNFSAEHYKWRPFFELPNQRAPYEDFTKTYRMPLANISVIMKGINEYTQEVTLIESAHFSSNCILKDDEELTVVLIIGESIRADHFGINGYHRNTTPKLSTIPGIISFSRMYSYGGATEFSFRSIMTGLTKNEEQLSRTSFVPILKKHGFNCSYYTENAANMCMSHHMKPVIGNHLDHSEIVKGDVIDVANIISRKINTTSNKRKFVIIQNGIGHYPYGHNIKYCHFKPSKFHTKSDDAEKSGLKNVYDNCIVAVDSFLERILTTLNDETLIVLYCSDHGELLGENGKWNHGDANNPYLRHVASFIWFSDTYKQRHPDIVAKYEQIKDKPLVHGQFYATILELCGIQSEIPLNVGSFLNDDFRNHPHNVPEANLQDKQ